MRERFFGELHCVIPFRMRSHAGDFPVPVGWFLTHHNILHSVNSQLFILSSGGKLDWLLQTLFGPLFQAVATCFTCLQYLQWVLGLTVPSVPRSRLANLDGGFEYGADREYASQFMCSNCC